MAVDLNLLESLNEVRWRRARLTRSSEFARYAKIIVANKQRYLDIVHRLQRLGSNMPDSAWVFIAVIHYRESTLDFLTHLGQGDPLYDKNGRAIKTVHVPAGRGPFSGADAFERAAVDALWYCAPYAAKNNKDWSIGGMLTYLERYNGLAYANVSKPSPYIWSGTDQYISGKVLVDHGPIVYYNKDGSPLVDKQLGVAGLILSIMAIDNSVQFVDDAPKLQPSLPEPDKTPIDGVYDTVWLQSTLNKLGATPQLIVDGIYGNATATAVRAFQKSHKLKVDGIAGTAETIPAMLKELA